MKLAAGMQVEARIRSYPLRVLLTIDEVDPYQLVVSSAAMTWHRQPIPHQEVESWVEAPEPVRAGGRR